MVICSRKYVDKKYQCNMAESKSQHCRCHVCLEVLKSPKILPCLHSFCQQCIHEIILSTIKNKEPKPKQFACPVCHTVVKPKDPTIDIENGLCYCKTTPPWLLLKGRSVILVNITTKNPLPASGAKFAMKLFVKNATLCTVG